jgi:hypothetical protein
MKEQFGQDTVDEAKESSERYAKIGCLIGIIALSFACRLGYNHLLKELFSVDLTNCCDVDGYTCQDTSTNR